MSRKYTELRRSYLKRYLIPAFGKRRISELRPKDLRDLKLHLSSQGKLAPATINVILGTARVMFNYAVRMGELENNTFSPVSELKEFPKERGNLKIEQLRMLFDDEAQNKVWAGDPRHYACNLLAATTGLRMGECQGLQVQYVHPQFVRVVHSWHDTYGLSAPKWNSARLVPIPGRTSTALDELIGLVRWGKPEPTDVVFWGRDRKTPLSITALLRGFKRALKRIGITDEQLRRVTGHKTIAMTDNYDAPGIEQLEDVLEEQERLFGSTRDELNQAVER